MPTGAGGTIYISGDVLKIFNSTFSYNNALFAGVMEVTNVREIQLNDSIFVDNFSNAAEVFNITRSTFLSINSIFYRNMAGTYSNSGCLVFTYGEASFENSTMARNINPGFCRGGNRGAIRSEQCELRISTCIFDSNEAYHGKDIFLQNDLFTYLSVFKHSQTYISNDTNFKEEVFNENIFCCNPDKVKINETQYASGKNLRQFRFGTKLPRKYVYLK